MSKQSGTREDWPEKRDLVYFVIMLAALCIVLATVNMTYRASVSEYIQFGSSLTSIVLALVSIFYTLRQGLVQWGATEQLKSMTVDARGETRNLATTSRELQDAATEIERQLKDAANLVGEAAEEVAQCVKREVEPIATAVGDIAEYIGAAPKLKEQSDSQDTAARIIYSAATHEMARSLVLAVHFITEEKRVCDLKEVANGVAGQYPNHRPSMSLGAFGV